MVKTAVLVLGMQNYGFKRNWDYKKECRSQRKNILSVLTESRDLSFPVYHIAYPLDKSIINDDPYVDLADFMYGFDLQSEPKYHASNYDAFNDTNLEESLRDCGIDTLIIMGFNPSATISHAIAKGYNVILPTDAILEIDKNSIDNYIKKWCNVTDSDHIGECLSELGN